jgi:plastocyanin
VILPVPLPMLARIRPVVSSPSLVSRDVAPGDAATRGRLTAAFVSLVLLTAACGGALPTPEVKGPEGRQFVPMVPDSIDNVGIAPSVTVDGAGLPNISYFGFPAKLVEGDIPVARPVGSPFLQTEDGTNAGAVLLASLTPEQIWTRGAVAQPRESPPGVPVPFEPAADPSLATLTPARAKGSDIAITGTDIHAAWTTDTGVWYGKGPSFEIGAVEETQAGAPSIVVDGSGAPIVAYTVAGTRPEVRVAERSGDRWRITPVTTLSACGADCPPQTQIALLGEEPLVVVADPLSGELVAAHRRGGTWATEVVASDVTGGASLATAGDTAAISFYTKSGVAVATGRPGSWSIEEVASVAKARAWGADGTVQAPPGTGVAVDGQGTIWVAWENSEGIHLASGAAGKIEQIDTPDAGGGVTPTLAVTEDGASVFLAWYDPEEGDLRLGTYAELPDLKIGVPSPAPKVVTAPGGASCGKDKKVVLTIVAQGTAFDPTCLVALSGKPFTIEFDDKDPVGTVGPHNIVIAKDEASTSTNPIFRGDLVSGPDTVEYKVPVIDDAGSYFFHCEVHPSMTGTLAVISG